MLLGPKMEESMEQRSGQKSSGLMNPLTGRQARRRRRPSGQLVKPLVAFSMLILFILPACYPYATTAPTQAATAYYETPVTVHVYAWGLLSSQPEVQTACPAGLDEVRVVGNFGYSLVTVLTLGFYAPTEVRWICAKEPPIEEEL